MKRNINIKAYDIVTLYFIAIINSQSNTLWPLRGQIVSRLQQSAVGRQSTHCPAAILIWVSVKHSVCLLVHDCTVNESGNLVHILNVVS